MNGLQQAVLWSGRWMQSVLPDTPWRSLLIDGVWSGVGSVIVFLPQILLLFLFIGILEDSGYLARAALIADRTMAKIGLQGKSFIPLLSAYACAVPAIMATRVIENKRDRTATIMIAPLMTCSARLPVYTLVIAAFVPNIPIIKGFLSLPAATMLGLYVLGFSRRCRSRAAEIDRAEERALLVHAGNAALSLAYLAIAELAPDRSRQGLSAPRRNGHSSGRGRSLGVAHLPLHDGNTPPLEHSYAGMVGKAIEPAIKPLGFNWKIGIGLITSLAAREVIVGTLGTIYGIEGDEQSKGLQQAVHQDLSAAGAVALLIFFAFAMQCFSTLAVVKRETGGWKWPIFQFSYMLALAYCGSWVAFHITNYLLG